jgi:hypothetical protein
MACDYQPRSYNLKNSLLKDGRLVIKRHSAKDVLLVLIVVRHLSQFTRYVACFPESPYFFCTPTGVNCLLPHLHFMVCLEFFIVLDHFPMKTRSFGSAMIYS